MVEQHTADAKPAVVAVEKMSLDDTSKIAIVQKPMFSPANIKKRGVTGTVNWFSPKRGYGVIWLGDAPKEGEADVDDVFVHFSTIAKPNPDHLAVTLGDGEHVKFDVASTDKGDLAVNVTSADGGAVRGHEKAPLAGETALPLWLVNTVPASRQPTRKYGHVKNADGVWTRKWVDTDVTKKAVTGRVAWFTVSKCCGEIVDGDGSAYWVHFSSVLKPNDTHAIESLGPNESVRFDVIARTPAAAADADGTKWEAVNVTAGDGGAVRGHAQAPKVHGHRLVPLFCLRHMGYDMPKRAKKSTRHTVKAAVEGETNNDDNDVEKKASSRKKTGGRRRRPRKHTQRSDAEPNADSGEQKPRTRRATADEGGERVVKVKAEPTA